MPYVKEAAMKRETELIQKHLRSYQKLVLAWALPKNRIALFLEMRLGKTRIALLWSILRSPTPRVLILCPASIIHIWTEELLKLRIPPHDFYTYHWEYWWKRIPKVIERIKHSRPFFFICSVDSIYRHPEFSLIPWTSVLLDESTTIKNPHTLRTKETLKMFREVPNRAILSGLPDPESKLDYFCQLRFLFPTFMGCRNYWEFRNQHFLEPYKWSWIIRQSSELALRDTLADFAYFLSRKDVADLPSKIYESRQIEMPIDIARRMKKMELTFELDDMETKWILVLNTWLHRACGGTLKGLEFPSKVSELMVLLLNELCREKVVVWYRFNEEIRITVPFLEKNKIPYGIVWGAENPTERARIVQEAREMKNGPFVLLCQTQCAAYGIDLSFISTAIFYSNHWSAALRRQAEDRIVGMEKNKGVLIIDLIIRDSVDQDLLMVLKEKKFRAVHFSNAVKRAWLERNQGIQQRMESGKIPAKP